MATKSFYLKDAAVGGTQYGSLQEGTSPTITAAATTQGWVVAKLAAPRYALMDFGVELASTAFVTTDPLSTTALSNTTGNAWRSENPYTGVFASANWTFALTFRPSSAGASGRCRVQLWKGSAADGSNATRIGAASAAAAGQLFGSTSTTYTFTSTVNPGAQTFSNEYLFVQVEWEITAAASANGNNVRWYIAGTGTTAAVVTSDFSAALLASADQTTSLPTQVAAGTIPAFVSAVNAAADQTTALPSQTATSTITLATNADQTTALPSQTATSTITLATNAAADQTTALPTQVATASGHLALDLDFTVGVLDTRVTFARASTGLYYNSFGVLTSAASDAPRFDYDPVALTPRGLLFEEQRSNIQPRSQDFADSSWLKEAVTLGGTVTAPDGTNTGQTINVLVAGDALLWHHLSGEFTAGAIYTLTMWAKSSASGGATKFRMNTNNTSAWNTGVGQKYNLTSQWQRFVLTGVFTNSTNCNIHIIDTRLPTDGSNDTDTALIGNVDIWGVQVELGEFATSYIPTTSVGVTRATDFAAMTGTDFSSWYVSNGEGEGSLFLEWIPGGVVSAAPRGLIGLNNGSFENCEVLQSIPNTVRFAILNGGGVQLNADASTSFTVGSISKAAIAILHDNSSAAFNGISVFNNAVFDPPRGVGALTRLDIGKEFPGGSTATMWARRVQYYTPPRLTNTELITLTEPIGGAATNATASQTTALPTQTATTEVIVKINAGADVTSGLLDRYPLDTNANDTVGVNNGVGDAAPTFTSGYATFDGSNQRIRIDSNFGLASASKAFSIRFRCTDDNGAIIGQRSAAGGSYVPAICVLSGGIVTGNYWSGVTDRTVQSPSGFADGNWHHVVWQHDTAGGGLSELFVDGISRGTVAGGLGESWWETTWIGWTEIGSGGSSRPTDNYFTGDLDDFRVYNRALTQSEISTLYSDVGQSTLLPTQTATATATVPSAALNATASQTTALPTQVATGTVSVSALNAVAAQTTDLPTQTSISTVIVKVSIPGNVIRNGTFDSDSEWVKDIGGGTTTISGGVASVLIGIKFLTQTNCLEAGKTYDFSFDAVTVAGINFRISNSPTTNGGDIVFGPFEASSGTKTGSFTAIATAFSIEADGAQYTGTIDNVIVTGPGQVTALSTQTATASVRVSATATQTTALPTQVGSEVILLNGSAAQTTVLPTQTATATLPLTGLNFTTGQTTALPTQTATETVRVAAAAAQTTPLPSQTATETVRVSASAAQTTALPTQTATETVRVAATATQATALPTQTATQVDAVSATVAQTTSLPAQTATGTIIIPGLNAVAAQTTSLPVQTATETVRVSAAAIQTTAVPTQTAAATLPLPGVNLSTGQTTPLPIQVATETIRVAAAAAQTTAVPIQAATGTLPEFKKDLAAVQTTVLPVQVAVARESVGFSIVQVTPANTPTNLVKIELHGAATQVTPLPTAVAFFQYGVFRRPTFARTRSENYTPSERPAVIPEGSRPWVYG